MATKRKQTRRRNASEAADLVRAFESSGLTRGAFCRRHKLATSTLDYWRRRIRRSGRTENAVIPLTVIPSAPVASYEIELGNGRRLRVSAPVDTESLAALLSVLDPC